MSSPKLYRVTTYVITEWTALFIAEDAQEARDLAYAEIEREIPYDGYVEQTSSLIESGDLT